MVYEKLAYEKLKKKGNYQPYPYYGRIKVQYWQERLTLRAICFLLVRIFLKSEKNLDDFLQQITKRFSEAYDSDFQNTSRGSPGIKFLELFLRINLLAS
ncbi:MAG: hypothetical protein NZL96_02120 [Patescibacteria group bacterium]|nr:hypothetical protein [Patescibacteria group bacterium]